MTRSVRYWYHGDRTVHRQHLYASIRAACVASQYQDQMGQAGCKCKLSLFPVSVPPCAFTTPPFSSLRLPSFRCPPSPVCANLPGGYSDQGSQSSCKFCGAGTRSNSQGTGCQSCAAGSYATAGSSSCTQCEQGKYQTQAKQSSCSICPAGYTTFKGTTAVVRGATSCIGEYLICFSASVSQWHTAQTSPCLRSPLARRDAPHDQRCRRQDTIRNRSVAAVYLPPDYGVRHVRRAARHHQT